MNKNGIVLVILGLLLVAASFLLFSALNWYVVIPFLIGVFAIFKGATMKSASESKAENVGKTSGKKGKVQEEEDEETEEDEEGGEDDEEEDEEEEEEPEEEEEEKPKPKKGKKKFCSSCGEELEPDEDVCPECGEEQ